MSGYLLSHLWRELHIIQLMIVTRETTENIVMIVSIHRTPRNDINGLFMDNKVTKKPETQWLRQ